MPHPFELRKQITLDATPEQVWEAIATGPGLDGWFMGRNQVEPREGGRSSMTIGEQTEHGVVTGWEPPRRFAFRTDSPEGEPFMAFEWLVEGRGDGTTVLRLVQSGVLEGDWETEYDALGKGWDLLLQQLAQYLAHFRGRPVTAVMVVRPGAGDDPERVWSALLGGLGLPGRAGEGERVRLAPAGLAPVEAVVDYVAPDAWGVRGPDGLYRFMHLHDGSMVASHHLYAGGTDPGEAERAWQAWLDRLFDQQETTRRTT